jgi:hypothetical protein
MFSGLIMGALLVSCSARQMRVEARADALDQDKVFIHATIHDGDEVVNAPRLIMLRSHEASAFVGETRDDVILSGYTLRCRCVGEDVLIDVEHHESGSLRTSWQERIPIRAACAED